jgi:hypothetical protein
MRGQKRTTYTAIDRVDEGGGMQIRDLSGLLASEIAGRRALEWTADLSRYHREPGMPGHRKALDHIVAAIEQLGLDEVEAREYEYDGKRVYYSTWASVAQWTPRVGILQVVKPEGRLLADFSEIPVTLGIRSAPTPPGGLTAELVDVGPGTLPEHYAGKDVAGKIVLCDPNGQLGTVAMDMVRLSGARGAVVCNLIDFPPVKLREDRPDHIGHVWTTFWWLGAPHDFSRDIFSFSISPRQLGYLRTLLARGPVTVRAVVEAEFSGGTVRQISGLIRGRELSEEEVVYLGHVDHPWPGANDNASGCGLMIELAGTLARLIRTGRLPRPRRSIRFLWDMHLIGGVMWAEDHPGWGGRVLGGFAPDSIGLGRDGGAVLQLMKTSDTLPSYFNDLTAFLAARIPANLRSAAMRLQPTRPDWYLKESHWSGGVDSGPINDRSIGAHTVGLGGFNFDPAYHTDRDTADRLDVQEFERTGWLMGIAGYFVADARPPDIGFIIAVVHQQALKRIANTLGGAYAAVEETETTEAARRAALEWGDRIAYVGKQAIAAVRSTRTLGNGSRTATAAEELGQDLARVTEATQGRLQQWTGERFGRSGVTPPQPSAEEVQAAAVIPVRRFEGPFNYHDVRRILATRIGWERTHWLTELQMKLPYPTLSLSGIPGVFLGMDGESTLLEIARRVRFEYGVAPDLPALLRLVGDLADAALIDARPRFD